MNRNKIESVLLKTITYVAMGITISSLVAVIGYILYKGLPHINLNLFAFEYTTQNLSLFPAIINTIIMVVLTLVIAVPFGVISAIYLVEYAKKGSMFVKIVQLTTETLQGIPSIVYGLFGSLFFVTVVFKRLSIISGALTLAIMILPLIMRSSEEALKSVPNSFREGSYGLGAGKLRTIIKIVLPYATNGILAGIILAIGRIVGETASLIYTAGAVAKVPNSIFDSGETLAIHMYKLWNEGLNTEASYATAVVLLIVVLIINVSSEKLAFKIVKNRRK
ncbi:MAG: phosphate ABC transporter permease PstA [Erysipelotrichaceae bacterium]